MTIITDAQTIRDETATGANTAERVGGCLVDIANAIDEINSKKYCFVSGQSLVVTPISAQETFARIVAETLYSGINTAFTVSDDCVLTATADGIYYISVVMSASIEAGTHRVSAALGSSSVYYSDLVVDTTLSGGVSNPSQITMNFAVNLYVGDTVAVWVTDNDHGHDILVSKISISAVKIDRALNPDD